ncbi:MAG TPA: RluA family pseudouridine synthase, partial [Fervidobacterium sp.]|nr:RluA family pseudouridine synthase [Fervidobacterium sp.]
MDEHNYFSRLDKFLRNALKNVPLSAIYKLIRTGK